MCGKVHQQDFLQNKNLKKRPHAQISHLENEREPDFENTTEGQILNYLGYGFPQIRNNSESELWRDGPILGLGKGFQNITSSVPENSIYDSENSCQIQRMAKILGIS